MKTNSLIIILLILFLLIISIIFFYIKYYKSGGEIKTITFNIPKLVTDVKRLSELENKQIIPNQQNNNLTCDNLIKVENDNDKLLYLKRVGDNYVPDNNSKNNKYEYCIREKYYGELLIMRLKKKDMITSILKYVNQINKKLGKFIDMKYDTFITMIIEKIQKKSFFWINRIKKYFINTNIYSMNVTFLHLEDLVKNLDNNIKKNYDFIPWIKNIRQMSLFLFKKYFENADKTDFNSKNLSFYGKKMVNYLELSFITWILIHAFYVNNKNKLEKMIESKYEIFNELNINKSNLETIFSNIENPDNLFLLFTPTFFKLFLKELNDKKVLVEDIYLLFLSYNFYKVLKISIEIKNNKYGKLFFSNKYHI